MNKILKSIVVLVLLVTVFLFGRISTNITYASDNVSIIDSNKVVFVNNDQTKDYRGKNYNFGNIEINKLLNMDKYKKNKLELVNSLEANHGLDKGDYGAAIVIPSNFTESVLSINNDISSKSVMTYEISDTLSSENQNEMIELVNSIIESIKADISYMYVYAIFDSLHTSQSGVNTVASNMKNVYGFTDSLESVDIFNDYEYEIKEYGDYDLSEIDLTDQEKEYVNTISGYVNEIDDSITKTQEDVKISNQDFEKYLISKGDDLNGFMVNLEKKMSHYSNLVPQEMRKIRVYNNELDSIDLLVELNLLKSISNHEIDNLNKSLSDNFNYSQKELKGLLDLYDIIYKLPEVDYDKISNINNNNNTIHDKNEDIVGSEIYNNISSYLKSSNEIKACVITKNIDQSTCLNNNLIDLGETNKKINQQIDDFQNKFNNNFLTIVEEIKKINSDSTYSEENLVKKIKEINNNIVVNIYKDTSSAYTKIENDVKSIIGILNEYNNVKKELKDSVLTKDEATQMRNIIVKDEEDIDSEDLSKVVKICGKKDSTDISCDIVENYKNIKKGILGVENALQPEIKKVDNQNVEYLNGSCANPMSVAYVYEGWECVEGTNKGLEKKLIDQNKNIQEINNTLTDFGLLSDEQLKDISDIIKSIKTIEVDKNEYVKVDYEKVDSSPYKENLGNISKSVQEEYNEVEAANNEIYEGMYDTYMENFDSYQEYIDNVSKDTTYEDMIKDFTGDENKRQEESLVYLEELSNLMPNSLTEDLPNKNIYNHIANPINYLSVDKKIEDSDVIKEDKVSINWYYVLLVLILFIIISTVFIVIKKVD